MPQYGRPSTDTTRVGWEENDGTTDALFGRIDETSADDADYIRTGLAPNGSVYVTKYTALEDPQVDTGHVVRYRYGKDAAGGAQINMTVQLRQGYVSEGNMGTLIAEWIHTDVAQAPVAAAQALTSPQAASITDYANLYLRVVATQV